MCGTVPKLRLFEEISLSFAGDASFLQGMIVIPNQALEAFGWMVNGPGTGRECDVIETERG